MTTKQWEVRVYLPGIIAFMAAFYLAAFLFYSHVKKHENRNGAANQPFQHKGDR